jgi:hypothetical protein
MIRVHTVKKPLRGAGLLLILGISVAAAALSGCQRLEKAGKNWESGMDGLNRTITLYDLQGEVLGRWNAKTYIETRREGIVAFLDSAGKEVKLAGGIVVVQEH